MSRVRIPPEAANFSLEKDFLRRVELICLVVSKFDYNHVHSAPQEHIESERKDSEHRKNTQNIHVHNITTIHKPHGLEK